MNVVIKETDIIKAANEGMDEFLKCHTRQHRGKSHG